GFKMVRDDPGVDVWSDTSALCTRILQGHVGPEDEARAEVVASEIITIHLADFMKQLASLRATGPTAGERAAALSRFGALFLGSLWDVYAGEVLSAAPF